MTENTDATPDSPTPAPEPENAPWPAMDEESPTLSTDSPSQSAAGVPADPSGPQPG